MGQLVPVAIGLAFVGLNSLITSRSRSSTVRNTVEGSQLDTNTPKAEYGYPINIFYGTVKQSSCGLIWAQPLREERIETESSETTTQSSGGGGKGGGGRTATNTTTTVTTTVTYNYYLTAAYIIGGTISSVRRVWLDGKLVYSATSSETDQSQTFLNHATIHTGSADQGIDSTIQSYEGDTPALRHRSYIVFDDYPVAEYEGNGFPLVDVEIVGEEANNTLDGNQWCFLEDVLYNLLVKSGIGGHKIDVSALGSTRGAANINLPGFVFSSGKTWRSAIEELQQIYFFIISEYGNKIFFYFQAEMELDQKNIILERFLGATDGDTPQGGYIQKELNAENIFSSTSIDFADVGNQLKENSIVSYNPSYTHQNGLDFTTTASLTSGMARDAADRILLESETQNIRIEGVKLLPTWSTLKAGDLFALVKDNDSGISLVYQITKITKGSNFLIELEAVRYKRTIASVNVTSSSPSSIPAISYTEVSSPTSSTYNPGETEGNFNPPEETSNYGKAEALPLDLPLLRDTDPAPLVYVAIKEISDWDTGTLYLSRDNEASYQIASGIFNRSLIGTVSVALPDHATALFDKVNIIRVVMDNNELEVNPVTNTDFLRGSSYLLLGSEIIGFRDVEVVSNDPLTYDISYLKRGHRGTEYYTDKHVSNESLIVLSGYKILVPSGQNVVNQTVHFKAVGNNALEPSVLTSNSLLIQGNSIKPLPPLPVLGDRNGNDLTITWYRRTRANGGLVDYAEIGYTGGELREYQLEILDNGTVVRTVTVTDAENYLYSEAQQITDFGSAQSEVDVRVRQKSSYPVSLNVAKITRV